MLKISFDFNEKTNSVSNVKVIKSSSVNTNESQSWDLSVDENKLILTDTAIDKLNAIAGDRVSVNYWTVDNQTTYPIISKSELFTDGQSGNKLTGKGTISFKGQQRTSLLKFGSLFTFTDFVGRDGKIQDGVFVLTPIEDNRTSINESDFTDEKEASLDLNSNNIEDEIDKILGNESYEEDVLPF